MELEKFSTVHDLQELFGLRTDVEGLHSLINPDATLKPKLDLFDAGDSYRVVLEVPGLSEDSLEVNVQASTLTVAGIREPAAPDMQIIMSERPSGHFQRTVELPGEVQLEASQAVLSKGLLILDLPKA